ncbi:DUF5665 domain-containing protein [Alkaliphilus serpentinus]|uniref:Uncharacterized protein n=1 Tax=Alkaliphilus serpentinus TaxID=1482731 RepID=A0A833HRD1_9FIRM|nr:DUF5665 domain-containing protein [Alkaliphilus serpentinus]KAB3533154.1 hypothetical protein F8153_00975 [Alkaliphilus serpentinus]
MEEKNHKKEKTSYRRLEALAKNMDNMRVAEYVAMINHPGRLIFMNFLLGLVRGFGMGIGFTILLGGLIYLMRGWVNLPVIGRIIADLLDIIENYR